MRIDRQRFVLLTASIAGGACVEKPTNVVAPVAAAPSATAASSAPAASVASVALASGPAPESGPSPDPYPSSASEGEGAAAIAPLAAGVIPGSVCGIASKPFDPTRTSCHDDIGSPASCSGMNVSGGCGATPWAMSECNAWGRNLKPAIAARAVSCELALSGTAVCDSCTAYRCGYESLMSACVDRSAAADCRRIAQACPSATTDACMAFLSGMTPAGRTKMLACMTQSRCAFGLYSCSEGLQ